MYETKRLILREWQAGDLEPFVAMNQDPNVMQYFPSTYSREQSMQQIANYQTALQKYCYTMFACELKTTKEFIGFVGLMRRESGYPFAPCTEIGWRIAYEFWNNGYATEAAFKCLDLGFKNFNLDKIGTLKSPPLFHGNKLEDLPDWFEKYSFVDSLDISSNSFSTFPKILSRHLLPSFQIKSM